VILHALGYFEPASTQTCLEAPGVEVYGPDGMAAVARLRSDHGWQTAVSGFVDQCTTDRMSEDLEEFGRAEGSGLFCANCPPYGTEGTQHAH
jgi:hypothetical protein